MRGITWHSLLAGVIVVLIVVLVSSLLIAPVQSFNFRQYLGLEPITGTPGTENPFSGVTPRIGSSCFMVMGGCGQDGEYIWNTSLAGDAICDSKNDMAAVKCPSGYKIYGGGCRYATASDTSVNIIEERPTNVPTYNIFDLDSIANYFNDLYNPPYTWWVCDWNMGGTYEIAYGVCCDSMPGLTCAVVSGGCGRPNGETVDASRDDIEKRCDTGKDAAAVKCPHNWKIYGGGCFSKNGEILHTCPTNDPDGSINEEDKQCKGYDNPNNGYEWWLCNFKTATSWETAYAFCCGAPLSKDDAKNEACSRVDKNILPTDTNNRAKLARVPVYDFDANKDDKVNDFHKDGTLPTSYCIDDNLESLCANYYGCDLNGKWQNVCHPEDPSKISEFLSNDADWQNWYDCCIKNVCNVPSGYNAGIAQEFSGNVVRVHCFNTEWDGDVN
ncbi:MAG: hypothetical protein QXD43_06150, partial [Candidatus Aenigmatarchaeota archaeon]